MNATAFQFFFRGKPHAYLRRLYILSADNNIELSSASPPFGRSSNLKRVLSSHVSQVQTFVPPLLFLRIMKALYISSKHCEIAWCLQLQTIAFTWLFVDFRCSYAMHKSPSVLQRLWCSQMLSNLFGYNPRVQWQMPLKAGPQCHCSHCYDPISQRHLPVTCNVTPKV